MAEATDAERESLEKLAQVLAVATPPPSEEPCLNDEQVASLVEGAAWPERSRAVDHLAACPSCRYRLSMVAALLRDPAVQRERRRLGTATRRRWLGFAVAGGVAASLAGFALAGDRFHPDPRPIDSSAIHRDGVITSTVAPRILAPEGTAGAAATLTWSSVPYADRYQVLMFDRSGTLVWNPQTADTTLALPPSIAGSAVELVWKVEARTGWDRWVASDWARFTPKAGGASR